MLPITWPNARLEVNVMDGIHELLKAILFLALLIWLAYGLLKWQALIHRQKRGREACIPAGMMKPVSKELAFLTNRPDTALRLSDK